MSSGSSTGPWARTSRSPGLFGVRNSLTASVYFEQQTLKDVFVRKAVGSSIAITRNLGRGAAIALLLPSHSSPSSPHRTCSSARASWSAIPRTSKRSSASIGCLPLPCPCRGRARTKSSTPLAVRTSCSTSSSPGIGRGQPSGTTAFSARGRVVPGLGPRRHLRIDGCGPVGCSGREFTGSDVDQSGIIHPQKRMFAGGANSVRGYAQSQLGPRVLTVGVGNLIGADAGVPAPCAPQTVIDLSCDTQGLEARLFSPRPTGGSGLFVGNTELRIRLTGQHAPGRALPRRRTSLERLRRSAV